MWSGCTARNARSVLFQSHSILDVRILSRADGTPLDSGRWMTYVRLLLCIYEFLVRPTGYSKFESCVYYGSIYTAKPEIQRCFPLNGYIALQLPIPLLWRIHNVSKLSALPLSRKKVTVTHLRVVLCTPSNVDVYFSQTVARRSTYSRHQLFILLVGDAPWRDSSAK